MKLMSVGVIYSLYVIVECLNFTSEVCFWWLVLLTGVAVYLRASGYLNIGIEKAMELLTKQRATFKM